MRFARLDKHLGIAPLYPLSIWLTRLKATAVALFLVITSAACAQPLPSETGGADAGTDGPATPVSVPALAPDSQVTLRSGELPDVKLTADLLYQILAAEVAIQRGELVLAANTTLVLARETTDPRLAQRAVELYAAIDELKGALASADVWVSSAPQNPEARLTQLALSAASGQTQGLVSALIEQVNQASDMKAAMGRVMAILKRMPDLEQALPLLDQVVQDSAANGTLAGHMALADMARATGNYPRALQEARAAMALEPSSEDAALRVLDYGLPVDAATALRNAKQFARDYPNSRQLRLMLAGKLAEEGDVDSALDELALMSAEFPEDFDLLFIRAQLAYRDQRLSQARALLEQYVAVQSQRQAAMASGASDAGAALADAYTMLARVAQDQGDPDLAIEFLGRVDDPAAQYSARLRQASIRAEQGRVDEAIAMVDAIHAADQDEQLIGVLTLSQILRKAERYEQAIERLEAANEEIPDSVEIQYELGMLLERESRHEDMEKYLRQVIELDPGYAHAYNALGYSLADRGVRLKEAHELIARAHQILPEDPYILDSLGWVKFRLGENKAAEKYLRQAYQISPEAEIAAHLGELLWVTGRRAEAREVWAQGQSLDAKDPALLDTLARFGVAP